MRIPTGSPKSPSTRDARTSTLALPLERGSRLCHEETQGALKESFYIWPAFLLIRLASCRLPRIIFGPDNAYLRSQFSRSTACAQDPHQCRLMKRAEYDPRELCNAPAASLTGGFRTPARRPLCMSQAQ